MHQLIDPSIKFNVEIELWVALIFEIIAMCKIVPQTVASEDRHANEWTCKKLPSIYQLGSDFVKQLFRIQIQKSGKVLLWNQVKSRIEALYTELILVLVC